MSKKKTQAGPEDIDPALRQIQSLDYSQYLPGVAIDPTLIDGVDAGTEETGGEGGSPEAKRSGASSPLARTGSTASCSRTPKGKTVHSPSSSRLVRVSGGAYADLRLFQMCYMAKTGSFLSIGAILEGSLQGGLKGVSKEAWEMYREMKKGGA